MGQRPEDYRDDTFVFRNDTKSYRVSIRLPDDGHSLADVDEITFRIWSSPSGSTVIEKTLTGGGVTIINATDFTFTLDNSETGIAAGHYNHVTQIIDSAGEPFTPLWGSFRVIDKGSEAV